MSQIIDTQTVRSEIEDALKRHYLPGLIDVRHAYRTHVINTMIGRIVEAASFGMDVKFKTRYRDSARMSGKMLGGFPKGMAYTVQEVRVRYNDRDQSINDFRKIGSRAQITEPDLQKAAIASTTGGPGAVMDLAQEQAVDIYEDIEQNLALKRHLPINGHLARLTTDVLRDNDGLTYATCNAFSSPETSVRFKITDGSLQRFWPGREIDVYNSAQTSYFRGTITDVNPADDSIGLDIVTPVTGVTSAAFGSGYIYLSGEKGEGGYYGFGAWTEDPASGFLGGVDRTARTHRFMNPLKIDAGSVTINKGLLDEGFQLRALTHETPRAGLKILAHIKRIDEFRNAIGEEALITSEDTPEENLVTGHESVSYRYPGVGKVMLHPDPMCGYTKAYCIDPAQVMSMRYGPKTPYMVDSMYRPNSDEAGAQGRGMVWFTDALLMGSLDFIEDPKSLLCWENLANN